MQAQITQSNEALEMAKTGDWDRAWAIAQCDGGLTPTATKGRWVAWARKAMARRAADVAQTRAHFSHSD